MTISQSDRAARSIADHMRIIEALERRDTELAERLAPRPSDPALSFSTVYLSLVTPESPEPPATASRLQPPPPPAASPKPEPQKKVAE